MRLHSDTPLGKFYVFACVCRCDWSCLSAWLCASNTSSEILTVLIGRARNEHSEFQICRGAWHRCRLQPLYHDGEKKKLSVHATPGNRLDRFLSEQQICCCFFNCNEHTIAAVQPSVPVPHFSHLICRHEQHLDLWTHKHNFTTTRSRPGPEASQTFAASLRRPRNSVQILCAAAVQLHKHI
jgi:hypothetical protein